MKILALDTATEACSAALMIDGRVSERFELAPRRHAELILPMIDQLLVEAGIGKRQLDAIAVGRGPGAFTGVRLAISIAQGLALALDLPVLPVSTLAALALWASAAAATPDHVVAHVTDLRASGEIGASGVLAVIDARMGEIYAGVYSRDADELVSLHGDEVLARAADLEVPPMRAWIVAGSGWGTYGDALRVRLQAPIAAEFPQALPRASEIARLGARDFRAGLGVDAVLAQPVYLRDKVALTVAEQAKSKR